MNRVRGDLAPKRYSSTKKIRELLVLVRKEVPEADDKTPGERLPLTHGVGGGQ